MKIASISNRWSIGMATILLIFPTDARSQPSDLRVEKILADWQQRQSFVTSIRYVINGQTIIPKGSLADDSGKPSNSPIPKEDTALSEQFDVLLDFGKNRFRMEMDIEQYDISNKITRVQSTQTLDGKDYFGFRNREANPWMSERDNDVAIIRNHHKRTPLQILDERGLTPLLCSHGLIPRTMFMSEFGDRYRAEDFIYHGQGNFAGRKCIVLRTFPFKQPKNSTVDEFWVDPSRNHLILRYLVYRNNLPQYDLQVHWQETPHGWLPESWTATSRTAANQVTNLVKFRVQEYTVEPGISDRDFQVEMKPGMRVSEDVFDDHPKRTTDPGFARKIYQVENDGSLTELINGHPKPSSGSTIWWILAGVIALGGLIWIYRRNKQSPVVTQ
jgi:hypothetical protein